MRAEGSNAKLETIINLKEDHHQFCLQATYFNKHSQINTIKVQAIDVEQHKFDSELEFKLSNGYYWQRGEVLFEGLNARVYKIVINVPQSVSIGDVMFCNGEGKKIKFLNNSSNDTHLVHRFRFDHNPR